MNAPAASVPVAARAAISGRIVAAGEWVLTLGLAANLAWTTLCLGGYLAATMVWSARATWALAALGMFLFAVRPRALDWRALLPVPFLVYALGSVLWLAPAAWLAWREWLLWLQMWIYFVLALHFARSRAQAWTLLGTLLALALAGAAMAAYQRFVDPKWMMLGRTQAEQFWTRSAGMFGIPNSLAALFEFALPLCLVWLGARSVDVTRKIACGWLAAVFLFALVLTGSRGGWIGAGAALLLWPLLTSRSLRRGALGAGAVLAVCALGLVGLYFSSEVARGRIDPFLRGEFESSRPIMWRVAGQLWASAPWFGTGAASYNVLFDRHRPAGFNNEPDWTHNDYLNTLSDYGLAGFALWVAAGAALLWLGWRAVVARREDHGGSGLGDALGGWRGRLALWLGLVAFAVHLTVDFHTKLPALSFWAAVLAALLVRGEAPPGARMPRWLAGLAVLPLGAGLLAAADQADALYRAEALRFDARRAIDRLALGVGRFDTVVLDGRRQFEAAVKIDPSNARAWADLSYAIALTQHITNGNSKAIGRRAEEAAAQAIALCPVAAEFWVQQGVARGMQGRAAEAEQDLRRALQLAPRNPEWHYHLAHHLSFFPTRRTEALAAVQTCLDLDPSNPQAKVLRARLQGVR